MWTKLGEQKSVLGTGWDADLAEGSPFHVLTAKRAGRALGSHGWPVQGSWGSSVAIKQDQPCPLHAPLLALLPVSLAWPGRMKPSLTHNTP